MSSYAPKPLERSHSEITIPYDNFYIFHDAENCHLSPRIVESRNTDGTINFKQGQSPSIQGAYVYNEVIRTGIASKIGKDSAKAIHIARLSAAI